MATSKQRAAIAPYYIVIAGTTCAYCGDKATDKEHVMSASVMLRLAELGLAKPSIVVPACSECNLLAHDSFLETFLEKRTLIREAIRKRYATLLSLSYDLSEIAHESDEEILFKVECIRKRTKLINRLNFEHQYTFSTNKTDTSASPNPEYKRKCPLCENFIRYKLLVNMEKSMELNSPCRVCKEHADLPTGFCTCICKKCNISPAHKQSGSCAKWFSKKNPMICKICVSQLQAARAGASLAEWRRTKRKNNKNN